ncbi:Pr6Pr family membrane protein [Occultella gossypii]|uniref:Pr6Pr family membrane protein n=1 Tax=Occultella gossypii TaxID=2800820 RepID=A0ABS7SHY2_9MICO|nr:Pr6Pr family membrane protein [Occultella gossypii]MBZ2198911.1 Pr6Pr family membrane protein [Occultella gossypii]
MTVASDPTRGPGGARHWPSTVVRALVVTLVISAEAYLIVVTGDRYNPSNHFSYFTILSNVFAAVLFAVSLVRPVPDGVRGAAVTFLLLTGVVANTLLLGVDVQTPAYASVVLHMVVPILVLVDWLITPPRTRLTTKHLLAWMVIPVAYLVYSLVRGALVDWYPYPFLDPREQGYGMVAVMSVVVAIAFGACAALVIWSGNRLRRRLRDSAGEAARERPEPG